MRQSERTERIERLANQLFEMGEAVQVLICWTENDETYTYTCGRGLWPARKGMAQDFLDYNKRVPQEIQHGDE